MVAWLHRCTDVPVDVLKIETSGGTLLATSEPCGRVAGRVCDWFADDQDDSAGR